MSLLAIKQNEPAAEAAGIDTLAWKMRAIMLERRDRAARIGGLLCGGASGGHAGDRVFGMLTSAQALIVALFGGVGTVWGPPIGRAILIPLAEILQAELGIALPGIQGVIFGMAIIAVILLAPDGIFWHVRDTPAPAAAHRQPSAEATPVRPATATVTRSPI